jgi:hypothetical protein
MALNYPKSMGTEWNKLKQDVKSAWTAANSRKPYQKIGSGILSVSTSLTVLAGAFIKFVWSTGNDGVYIGRYSLGGQDYDGVIIYDRDNVFSFVSQSRVSDGYRYTALYDKQANIVVSNDAGSGEGLARPWLEHSFVNTAELVSPPTSRQNSTTTDAAVVSALVPVQHSYLNLRAYVYNPGGGSNQVKVKDVTNGVDLFAQTYAGTNYGFINETFAFSSADFGDDIQLDVTIRRTSGAGAVGITVLGLVGVQTP